MIGDQTPRKKSLFLTATAITLLYIGTVVQAMPLTGVVLDSNSNGIAATVELYEPKDGILAYSIQADAAGVFSFSDVMEMDYCIRISNTAYPDQWYSHWGNTVYRQYTTRIDVATISDTLRMEVGATPETNPSNNTLTVTFTDSTGGTLINIGELYVTIIRRMDYFIFPGYTVPSGTAFTLDSLQDADYYIEVSASNYPAQYFDPTRNTSNPTTPVILDGGQNHRITFRLVDPPAGEGVFNGYCLSETNSRLSGITVTLCQPYDTFRVLYSQISDANGNFSFENILDMDYYIRLSGSGYPEQWFSQSRSATTLYPDDMLWPTHYAGDTVAIRLSAAPIDNPAIGSITIVAIDSTGTAQGPPGYIELIDANTSLSYTPGFDPSISSFVGHDIPAGNYAIRLNFAPYPVQYFTFSGPSVSPEYVVYINPNDNLSIQAKVKMNPGQTSTQSYGFIQGTVTDSTGPVAGAVINIIDQNQNVIQSITSIGDGSWQSARIAEQGIFVAVQASLYPVQFWSPQGMLSGPYQECYMYISSADTFYLDAFLVPYPPAGNGSTSWTTTGTMQISGQVYTESGGNPLSGIRVSLISPDQPNDINTRNLWSPWTAYSDSAGYFTIYNIPYGNYRCMADADTQNFIAQFYPKADRFIDGKIVVIDSVSSPPSLGFSLRQGGTLKGSVVSTSGTRIGNARIEVRNNDNSRWFESWTTTDGNWIVSGLPEGYWNVWVSHDRFLPVDDNIDRNMYVTERTTQTVQIFTMDAGGYFTGTFTTDISLYDTGSGNLYWGNCYLFSENNNDDNFTLWPEFHSSIQFESSSSDGYTGTFRSNAIKSGDYRICYSPQPQSWEHPEKTRNVNLLPGLSYRFFGNTTIADPPPFYTIQSDDSLQNLSLALKKGYSIFGTIADENGLVLSGNYGIEAMARRDSLWFMVSQSTITPDGRFELPGLIDGEDYFLSFWADGYPHQYWSPEGNTANPKTSFHFSASEYTPLALHIVKNPAGIDPSQIPGPLSLWIDGDSLGFPLLRWEAQSDLAIENFILYSTDRTGALTELYSIPRAPVSAGGSFRDRRALSGWRDYVVVGKGTSLTVRSNLHGYDPRSTKLTSDSEIWFDAFKDRWGIELEWGLRNNPQFASTESVTVFKSIDGEPFKLLYRRPAWEMNIHDGSWDHRDSGKTYRYYVELPSRGVVSSKISVTLDAAFFAQLSNVLMVGPYEQYQRITDAIAAAKDFDHIQVGPGTYKENLSFKGKVLSIDGSWNYGSPPVIDGGGGVAVTVPVCSGGNEWERPRISGFIIRNSTTAIKSMYHIDVSECLFDNVSVAVSMNIDSTALLQQITSNPFKRATMEGQINHCTIIARKSGSLVASATSIGIAEQTGYTGTYSGMGNYYIKPAVSLSTRMHIGNSSIAYYQSNALQTSLPATLQGNSTRIEFDRCNFWKTATTARSTGIELISNNRTFDPQFSDSTNWFVAETSPLRGTDWETWIGYDIRRYGDKDDYNNENRPSPIRNLVVKPVGLNRIFLKWTVSPSDEKITRYRIYRIPGDPSLFYINQYSQWDLKISDDSLFSIVDSFSTTSTAFLDTTITLGKPYLYVVAAVNSEGNESDVSLPAPPDISSYFINTYSTQLRLAAQKWQMIGTQGGSTLSLPSNTQHAVFDWDDKRTPDKTYSQYGRAAQLQVGTGYWFKSVVDTVLSMSSASLSALKSMESTMQLLLKKGATGWNLVSSPFPFSIVPGWLGTFSAWEWNADSLGYRKATSLQPWKAYWVFTSTDTTLQLWKPQPLSYYLLHPLAKTASIRPLWSIRISLQRNNSFDTDNFIGAVPAGLSKSATNIAPEPPAPFDGARLYIIDTDASEKCASRELAQLYRPISGKKVRLEWLIGISPSDVPSEVTLHDIETLPQNLYAFWIEENRVINIREQQSISVAAKSTETFGYIVVTSNPADLALFTGKLVLRNPFPNPFRGAATIEYTLPYTWLNSPQTGVPVTLSIFDIRGKRIVQLVNKQQQPGFYRTVWNGENSNGGSVSAGMYLIKLCYGKNFRISRLYRIQ